MTNALASLCVHEEFEYCFPSKLLYSISPGVKEQSQLLKLTEPETRSFLQGILNSTTPQLKRVKFRGKNGGPTISLSFDQLIMFLVHLFKMNSDNCVCFVEADPLPVLVTLFTSEETSVRENTVQLVLNAVHYSKHHKHKVLQCLEGFMQVANVEIDMKGEIIVYKIIDPCH